LAIRNHDSKCRTKRFNANIHSIKGIRSARVSLCESVEEGGERGENNGNSASLIVTA